MSRPRPIRLLISFALLLSAKLPAAALPGDLDDVWSARRKDKDKPLPRVREMLDWIAVEQQGSGGWACRLWLPLRYHLHNGAKKPQTPPQTQDVRRPEQERMTFEPRVFDSAMSGLALVRSGSTLTTGDYHEQVTKAAEYLYVEVQSSSDKTVWVSLPSPFTERIGRRADTFAALLFFVTLREQELAAINKAAAKRNQPPPPIAFRYDGAIDKLLNKTQSTLNADGKWPAEGTHVPMLSHAMGCWALEAALRAGLDVKPELLSKAEKYAMTKEAEEADFNADGKYRKSKRFKPPNSDTALLRDDDDPLGHQTYLMSARLAILYQADLTNRLLLDRERAKTNGRTLTADEYSKFNALSAAASRTTKALEEGRAAIRKTWTTVYEDDADPCPAPIAFTGEDYLSSLMVVDAMASCPDVTKWYPPLVRDMMFHQDVDGGLRTREAITCRGNKPCLCGLNDDRRGRPLMEVVRELQLMDEFNLEPQFCPAQNSWCSRDRTFITAAGTMILLAETPYRAAFVSQKAAAAAK